MIKHIFTALNLLLITFLAYMVVQNAYIKIDPGSLPEQADLPEKNTLGSDKKNRSSSLFYRTRNQRIINRNIFNVLTQEEAAAAAREGSFTVKEKILPAAQTSRIALKGTVTGGGKNFLYAVIEEKTKREQNLFKIGDTIDGALLKDILKDHIIIEKNGQALRIDLDEAGSSRTGNRPVPSFSGPGAAPALPGPAAAGPPVLQKQIQINTRLINTALNDRDKLTRQIKFRAHNTNGEPDGTLIYGIRPDSVFRQLGLRNGDVIREVNGVLISGSQDIIETFAGLTEESAPKITLLRGGRPNRLVYSILATDEDLPADDEEAPLSNNDAQNEPDEEKDNEE